MYIPIPLLVFLVTHLKFPLESDYKSYQEIRLIALFIIMDHF